MFPATKVAATACLGRVRAYVHKLKKSDSAKNAFLNGADPMLVAYALRQKAQLGIVNPIVVTGEKSAKEAKVIKLPDVCEGLGIECIDAFEMLNRENPRFVLEES